MDLPISRHVRIGDPIRMPDGSNAYCVAVVGGSGGDSRLMLNAYSDVIDEKENGEVMVPLLRVAMRVVRYIQLRRLFRRVSGMNSEVALCERKGDRRNSCGGDAHRNIVSTRKIRTSRMSLLFTSPVPPCCIAAGCSPGKKITPDG